MQHAELLEQLERDGPMHDTQEAERALRATVTALSRCLSPRDVRDLAALFPELLGGAPEAEARVGSRDALYAQVAQLEQIELQRAVEHTQVVCLALARRLAPGLRERLAAALPREIGELLSLPERSTHLPPHHRGHERTLAEGHAGSDHPLSATAPGSRHPVSSAAPHGVQQDSVAADNPHADTKISSSPGLTQQREKESLAQGRSKRP